MELFVRICVAVLKTAFVQVRVELLQTKVIPFVVGALVIVIVAVIKSARDSSAKQSSKNAISFFK